jgi:hypothetical protein
MPASVDDELALGALDHVLEQRRGRADELGFGEQARLALGMRDELGLGMLDLELGDLALAEGLVDDAGALPEPHRSTTGALARPPLGACARPYDGASRLLGDKGAQVAVRGEEDGPVARDLLDDPHGVGARHDDVALGFDGGRAVDVARDEVVGVLRAEAAKSLRRAAVGKRAAGAKVRKHHLAAGIEDLGAFGHEVHAREDDQIRLAALGLARELEAVAHEVGDVLDVRFLVIMGQDHGVLGFFEPVDLVEKVESGGYG